MKTVESMAAQDPAAKAELLTRILGAIASDKDQAHYGGFDAAWEGVDEFPVMFDNTAFIMQRNPELKLGSCGALQITGIRLERIDGVIENYAPRTLFESGRNFTILPPSLVTIGVQ